MIDFVNNKIFFFSKMSALFVGLCLALAFQFTGIKILALIALAFFAAAFLMMSVTEIANIIVLQNYKVNEDSQVNISESNDSDLGNNVKLNGIYNKKLVSAVKLLLCGAMAAFSILIMFLL